MKRLLALVTAVVLLIPTVWAQVPETEGRWDLTEIYADQAAYQRELDSLQTDILPRIRARAEQLRNPGQLLNTLLLLQEGNLRFQRLSAYVTLQMAADQSAPLPKENLSRLRREIGVFSQGGDALEKELTALEPGYLQGCLEDARFADVAPLLLSVLASQGRETSREDSIFSHYAHLHSLPGDTATLILGADFHPPAIIRPDGTSAPATYTEWMRSRFSDDVDYRRAVYEGYHGEVRAHRNTLAAQLDAHIRTAVADAKSRGFDTPLRQALSSRFALPPPAVTALLTNVRDTLALHRRFGELRLRRAGKEALYPWDVAEPRQERGRISFAEACERILASLAPLGTEYVERARSVLTGTHIDVYPRDGKQTGAFAIAVGSGIAPYILLNYAETYEDMSTLTHELGHAMHMLYTEDSNPPLLCQTPVSLAEIASTAHELLLIEHMLKNAPEEEHAFFLRRYADLIGGTVFGQTQLFAFELSLYTAVESGGTVTADLADRVWQQYRDEFHAAGQLAPESAASSWAAIPHFYRNFYVMNYATSLTAAYSFAEAILAGKADGFLGMLRSGGSENAHALLCSVGVDLTGDKAYRKIMKRYEEIYRQLEKAG